ncbi:hypothetical protein H634G_06564 [Metarhizium anisopliae BRIP 53293]|uniref:Uncharacterized protein n=1 Tax=Metarhizium anisopliae BRIP 53293 TaxID=1291518 RepID=A0A0D9NX00_METAN|nr:hypothetical protein H634G_06564 [Metarhizium anisopliae BRIP 53293]KJK88712.1 hypothetical protein H633G_07444 [Metarhizium anisopliae BRIP 53284]
MAGFAASRKKRSAEPAHDSRTESTTTSDPSSSHQRPPKRQAPSPAPNSPPARDLPGLPDNQIRDLLPIVPTSATTSPSNYGRINAENESNLVLLESMPNEVNHYRQRILRKMSGQITTASGGEHHDTTFADPEKADEKLAADYPYDHVWPPPTIPARHHVSGARSGQAVVDLSQDDRPRSRGEVSDQTFRIRQWMQMPGTPPPPSLIGGQAGSLTGMVQVLNGLTDADNVMLAAGAMGVHIGEEVITYSTLDPVLYTPTSTKPWRGIWVGDYSGHGCEFLLINQPDDPHVTDAELGLVRDADETDEAWEKRRREAHMYRGRLEAIKLTGDPNVPRGEYTFVSDDLGPGGYVGVATDPPFAGARVVKSKGHVAATGFIQGKQMDQESLKACNPVYWEMSPLLEPITDGIGVHAGHADKYIESQLLLIGPNRLAQYWVGFGHISFFERVQVDDLIIP